MAGVDVKLDHICTLYVNVLVQTYVYINVVAMGLYPYRTVKNYEKQQDSIKAR